LSHCASARLQCCVVLGVAGQPAATPLCIVQICNQRTIRAVPQEADMDMISSKQQLPAVRNQSTGLGGVGPPAKQQAAACCLALTAKPSKDVCCYWCWCCHRRCECVESKQAPPSSPRRHRTLPSVGRFSYLEGCVLPESEIGVSQRTPGRFRAPAQPPARCRWTGPLASLPGREEAADLLGMTVPAA
jgi:hypothetical protein